MLRGTKQLSEGLKMCHFLNVTVDYRRENIYQNSYYTLKMGTFSLIKNYTSDSFKNKTNNLTSGPGQDGVINSL